MSALSPGITPAYLRTKVFAELNKPRQNHCVRLDLKAGLYACSAVEGCEGIPGIGEPGIGDSPSMQEKTSSVLQRMWTVGTVSWNVLHYVPGADLQQT